MGLEKQTRQIGEFSYEVTPFGAKLGNRVLLKVLKSIAPVFLAAASVGSLKDVNVQSITSAIAGISEDDFEWLVDQFAGQTDVLFSDAKRPTLKGIYDLHFAGRYVEELEWIAFVVEVNYGPFFQDMKRKAAEKLAASAKAPSQSKSPVTSTGPSNAS